MTNQSIDTNPDTYIGSNAHLEDDIELEESSDKTSQAQSRTEEYQALNSQARIGFPSLHKNLRKYKWRSLKLWWLEMLGAITLLLSLVAIIWLLEVYQDQELSKWPHRVSINTVIAVFAAILTACVRLVIVEGELLLATVVKLAYESRSQSNEVVLLLPALAPIQDRRLRNGYAWSVRSFKAPLPSETQDLAVAIMLGFNTNVPLGSTSQF